MDTKEAIELLNTEQDEYMGTDYWDKMDKIIELLKCGEKYKTIFEEFARYINVKDKTDKILNEKYKEMWQDLENKLIDKDGYNEYSWSPNAMSIMKELEQKYFKG